MAVDFQIIPAVENFPSVMLSEIALAPLALPIANVAPILPAMMGESITPFSAKRLVAVKVHLAPLILPVLSM